MPQDRQTRSPTLLKTTDAVFYTVWLYAHGSITTEERRWLLANITRARTETP